MNTWMDNVKLRTKLLGLVAILIVALVGLGIYCVRTADKMAEASKHMYENSLVSLEYALEAKTAFLNISTALYQNLVTSDAKTLDANELIIQQKQDELRKALRDYEPLIVTDKQRRLIPEINGLVKDYEGKLPQVLALARAAKVDEALKVAGDMRDSRLGADAKLNELVELNKELAADRERANNRLARSARLGIPAAVGLVSLLGLALSLAIILSITKPLRDVIRLLGKTEHFDLVYDNSFNHLLARKDDIGEIAISTASMRKALRELATSVKSSAEQVASASQQLSASAEQVGQATNQVSDTIQQLAAGSGEQARQAQDAGAVVENMSASIQQVSAAAQKMAEDAGIAVEIADSGRKSVAMAAAQMDSIAVAAGKTAEAIHNLGSRSSEIGRIVDVITGIADQTNLLALNAAIEAARAGEQGRGFAVVAEEVRQLAEQSRTAAEQISGLIDEIQRETGMAVTTMDAGSNEISAGTEVVKNAGEAFASIADAVSTVVAQIQEVTAATQSLAAGSEQAVKAVESIAAITEESAAGAEEVSGSTEEQNASVQEIASSSESLARMAEELEAAVAVFSL